MTQLVQMYFVMLTVLMEAGAESYQGKLAVAYTICTRARKYGRSFSDVVLAKWQFTAWEQNSPTRMNIDQATDGHLAECLRATLAAMFNQEPDPTNGAEYYLNPQVVIAASGKLPDWWDIDGAPESEVRIGKHVFRCKRQ